MLPVVIRPKILAAKNRWKSVFHLRTKLTRDLSSSFLILFVMWGIHSGTAGMLIKLKEADQYLYLPPLLPLSLLLLFLCGLLIFSNVISTLGAMYLGEDLELILSSPMSFSRFYLGKLSEVFASSSWMVIVFGGPSLLAFGQAYDVSLLFYSKSLLVLLPLLLIPSALSIALVTLFVALFPAHRAKEVFIVLFAICTIFLLFSSHIPFPGDMPRTSNSVPAFLSQTYYITHHPLLPSYWAAVSLSEFLSPSARNFSPHFFLLISTCVGSAALSYIIARLFHARGFSNTKNGTRFRKMRSIKLLDGLSPIMRKFNPQYIALFAKEYKLFARDITQAVQLILLLGICIIYLYNFNAIHAIQTLSPAVKIWWKAFLVISNILLGSFVIIAVCARFVFPTFSLEGKSFWIIQSAPMSPEHMLRAKFWFWLIPLATIASVILASGALAIQAAPQIVIISALCGWIICYGVVGLGVALGTIFINLRWEHSSQLTTGFGSLVYMLLSTALVIVDLIPTGLLIFMRTLRVLGYELTDLQWYSFATGSALLLAYLNYVVVKIALKTGASSLSAIQE